MNKLYWISLGLIPVMIIFRHYIGEGLTNLLHFVGVSLTDSVFRGAVLMGVLYTLKDWFDGVYSLIWNATIGTSLIDTIKISTEQMENTPLYEKLARYLAHNYSHRIGHMRVNVIQKEYQYIYNTVNGKKPIAIEYVPEQGSYIVWFNGAPIWVSIYHYELGYGVGWDKKPATTSTIYLTVLGFHSNKIKEFIREAKKYAATEKNSVDYKLGRSWVPDGEFLISKPQTVTLDNLFLSKKVERQLLSTLDNFVNHPEIWEDNGLARRESFLLSGPPGNGKSMITSFIAGYVGYDILLLNLTSKYLDDDDLLLIMARIPQKTVIIIEEIDAACPERDFKKEVKQGENRQVTLGGLLLALDGPANKDGPIIVATTNAYESLDEALTRVGRFNHHIHLDWADDYQKECLFEEYYPSKSQEATDILLEKLQDKNMSCAALVGFFRSSVDNNISDIDCAKNSKLLQSAEEVGGSRINLDSHIRVVFDEINAPSYLWQPLVDEGIDNLRLFKYAKKCEMAKYLLQGREVTFKETLLLKQAFSQLEKEENKNSEALPILIKCNVPEWMLNYFESINIRKIAQFESKEVDGTIEMLNKANMNKLTIKDKILFERAKDITNNRIIENHSEYDL
eukprot:TRINITY_DN7294_c0_g1_i1.p1 TRINITY_DN7294_c0_g1~~TRINITY_DN7294_c0_g1_i1.p1  ORF type:complete len:623 (-),score=120.16 TRINITY_DN7294_c0_g1_i1:18-1886(-)